MENDDNNLNEICRTDYICPESGYWICEDHPAVRVYVHKGGEFPKCYHVSGHSANWILEHK